MILLEAETSQIYIMICSRGGGSNLRHLRALAASRAVEGVDLLVRRLGAPSTQRALAAATRSGHCTSIPNGWTWVFEMKFLRQTASQQ